MKNFIYTFLLSIIPFALISQNDTIYVKSEIQDITVFFNGANILRNGSTELTSKQGIIAFKGLPVEISSASIQAKIDGAEIMFVDNVEVAVNNFKENKKAKAINEEIEAIEWEMALLKNKKSALDFENKLLRDNSDYGRSKWPSVETIKNTTEYYRIRTNQILDSTLKIRKEHKELINKLNKVYTKYNKLYAEKAKPTTTIFIGYKTVGSSKTNINIRYFVPSAAWVPKYDFRLSNTNSPLEVAIKANVYQSTGEDWPNIKLNLSTRNPALGISKPELETYYINRSRQKTVSSKDGIAAIQGRISDTETGESIPFANIILTRNGRQIGGTTSDFDGNYRIKPVPSGVCDIKSTFVGYKTVVAEDIILKNEKITFYDIEMSATSEMLEEIMIVEYTTPLISKDVTSSGASVTADEIYRMPNRNANAVASTVGKAWSDNYSYDTNPITEPAIVSMPKIDFQTESPFSILSNGDDNLLQISRKEINVDYEYYCVPKIDESVFLVATIKNLHQHNLLEGEASIYTSENYIGNYLINPNGLTDSLSVSLGREKEISVSRELKRKKNDRIFLGNNIKEIISWEIKIKNNKNHPVKITIEDQYPISERSSINVELMESSSAKVNEKTGKLSWEMKLKPGQDKELIIKYSVKYPKYSSIVIE